MNADDKGVLGALEQIALELAPGDSHAVPYAVNYTVLNNIRTRIKHHNTAGVYDDSKTLEQCNVRISQNHIGQCYFITITKVKM